MTPLDESTPLSALLHNHALDRPSEPAFIWLGDGEEAETRLTWSELDRQARAIAAWLIAKGYQGQRALLLYVPGLDFVSALYGCLYAGVIAVPAYPPDPARLARTLPRMQAVVRSAAPAIALTTSPLLAMAPALFEQAPDLAAVRWVASDELAGAEAGTLAPTPGRPNDMLLLQYTSGSTAMPKGVEITGANLMSNCRAMQRRCRMGAHTVIASWVPFYHDMGLVGAVCLPVVLGGRSVLLSPIDFLRRPIRWLRAIDRHRATATGAPNFALDLCADAIGAEEAAALDLSTLEMLLVGGEPLRASSFARFAERFAPSGLRRQALFQGYGLAEAVLAVSAGSIDDGYTAASFDARALASGRVRSLPPGEPGARAMVSCGRPLSGTRVEIVEPTRHTRLASDAIGEVWVAGPSVARGYWQDAEATREVFNAHLADVEEAAPFLRTGDLGFFHGGELYISGRIKDTIILRGKNHHPQDIEETVERAHPRVRRGGATAFSVDRGGAERLVIAVEVDSRGLDEAARAATFGEVVSAVRAAVRVEHEIAVSEVALIGRLATFKTSSGKLARHATLQALLDGTLPVEHRWQSVGADTDAPLENPAPAAAKGRRDEAFLAELRSAAAGARAQQIEAWLRRRLDAIAPGLGARAGAGALEVDSLSALSLSGVIEIELGVKLADVKMLLAGFSLRALASGVLEALDSATVEAPQPSASRSALVELAPMSARRPLFLVGGAPGAVGYLEPLARALGTERAIYALLPPGLDGVEAPLRTVEAMADRCVAQIRGLQPEGPYALAGHSFGGLVALEIAQQLRALGESVAHLALLDTSPSALTGPAPAWDDSIAMFELLRTFTRVIGAAAPIDLAALEKLSPPERSERLRDLLGRVGLARSPGAIDNVLRTYEAMFDAMVRYTPRAWGGPLTLYRASEPFPADGVHRARNLRFCFEQPLLGWDAVCSAVERVDVPGNHFSMVAESHVRALGDALRRSLERDEGPRVTLPLGRIAPAGAARSRMPAKPGAPDTRVDLDPFDQAFVEDPFPLLRRLREQSPVERNPGSPWFVTGHAATLEGLRDRRLSTDSRNAGGLRGRTLDLGGAGAKPSMLSGWIRKEEDSPLGRLYNNVLALLDPPRHTRLRGLLAEAFHPAAIQRWRAPVHARVGALLAALYERDDVDLIRDLALPLPVTVISELIGIPIEEQGLLRGWTASLTSAFDPMVDGEVFERAVRVVPELMDWVRGHVERRREHPSDDLLGLMCRAELEGDRLTMDELVANCVLLFVAGFETTTNAIGNGILALLRHRDQLALLAERPELLPNAVEEVLRFDGPFRHVYRTAAEDLKLGGRAVRRGETVLFLLPGANRDPAVFPDPDRFDVARANAGAHVAFGQGRHACLGAGLARLETEVALGRILPLLPHMTAVESGLWWRRSLSLRGLDRLPVVLDRAKAPRPP